MNNDLLITPESIRLAVHSLLAKEPPMREFLMLLGRYMIYGVIFSIGALAAVYSAGMGNF